MGRRAVKDLKWNLGSHDVIRRSGDGRIARNFTINVDAVAGRVRRGPISDEFGRGGMRVVVWALEEGWVEGTSISMWQSESKVRVRGKVIKFDEDILKIEWSS